MNEKEAKKKISDIIFKALTQKEPITPKQDRKIKDEIKNVLGQIN